MKNKKAAEKIMSVYWFVILFLVAGAIVYMVISFYGKPYDVRGVEASLLADKAANCVSYAGYLREGFSNQASGGDLLSKCNLNFNVEDVYGWKNQGQYFLDIRIYDFNTYQNSNPLAEVSTENANLKDFCKLSGKSLPLCLERGMYVLDKSGKQYFVKITSIIQKAEKNV